MKQRVALQRTPTQSVRERVRKVYNHVQCDGGLTKSGLLDNNNCTIRAFAIAFGMSYKDAYLMGELAGREHGKGFWMYKIMAKAKEYGYNSIEYHAYETLGQFLKKNNTGRFICARKGHAFCIINGKIYDQVKNHTQCKLIRIFKVESRGMKSYIQENHCV